MASAAAATLTSSLAAISINSSIPTVLQAESDDPGIQRLHQLHESLLTTINSAHSKTSHLLQSQEHDLLSAFQTRLLELHNELLQERQKSEVGSSEWIQRCQTLTHQSQLIQAKHHQLQQSHTQVKQQYRTLQREYRLLEETRDILVKNLVVLKRQLHHQIEGGAEQLEEKRGSLNQPSSLRSRPTTAHAASTRPSSSSRPTRPSTQQRPFTASLHNTRSPIRWSREWNDRPHSAAVSGGITYSQSVHQRPTATSKSTDHASLSSDENTVSMEQHYKQLLAISHQQHEKLHTKYEQLQRRHQEKILAEKELTTCVRQVFHRLFVEPYEPAALKSILQRPASSGTGKSHTAYRPSSAASVTSTSFQPPAPTPPTIPQLTREQRTTVLHQLAVDPTFWNFVDSIVSNTQQTVSPASKSTTAASAQKRPNTAHTTTGDIHSRLAELLTDSDEDTVTTSLEQQIEQEFDDTAVSQQQHDNSLANAS